MDHLILFLTALLEDCYVQSLFKCISIAIYIVTDKRRPCMQMVNKSEFHALYS